MDKYIETALKEAEKAYKNGDIPVGAVIVKDNKIIAKAFNKKEKKSNAILHAEIIAIEKACKKLKTWHLEETTLYVTLEPCMMCCGAIIQSRITTVKYGCASPKFGYIESLDQIFQKENNHKPQTQNLHSDECEKLIKSFFKKRRLKIKPL